MAQAQSAVGSSPTAWPEPPISVSNELKREAKTIGAIKKNRTAGPQHASNSSLLGSALLLAAMALGAVHSAHAVTVRLADADASAMVNLHVGDRIRLELHTAPATGFRWAAKKLDASHLEQLSKDIRPDSGRLDTAGIQVFVWKAISAGNAEIGLEYSRPSDDRTIPPTRRIGLKVQVAADELAPQPAGADDALDPVVQPVAMFQGKLPCADCLAIAVQLRLLTHDAAHNARSFKTGVFVETRRYQGAPGGDKTIAETGQFAVVHGTYADPSITLYVLGSASGGTENFRVEADRLVPLDPQGLPVPLPPGRDPTLYRVANEDQF